MRCALGLTDADLVIGAVGRAERQKRFDLLLDAMVPIFARHPAARLVVAGAGSTLAALERQATRLGVAERCVWTGHRQDVADLHHAFDLFVQSSEYEGTPNAVLEAMAMETPIVATDVGGTRELAVDGEHALLVPAHDVTALTHAIECVVQDPGAARSRARAARGRVEAELSFSRRTRRIEDIYMELVHA
jgi:glycosyltransferase involved in cell wall biosynthesis